MKPRDLPCSSYQVLALSYSLAHSLTVFCYPHSISPLNSSIPTQRHDRSQVSVTWHFVNKLYHTSVRYASTHPELERETPQRLFAYGVSETRQDWNKGSAITQAQFRKLSCVRFSIYLWRDIMAKLKQCSSKPTRLPTPPPSSGAGQ